MARFIWILFAFAAQGAFTAYKLFAKKTEFDQSDSKLMRILPLIVMGIVLSGVSILGDKLLDSFDKSTTRDAVAVFALLGLPRLALERFVLHLPQKGEEWMYGVIYGVAGLIILVKM